MTRAEYWQEAVSSALEDAGVTATSAQIATIAESIEVSNDNLDLAFHVPENPLHAVVEEERRARKRDADDAEARTRKDREVLEDWKREVRRLRRIVIDLGGDHEH